MKRWRLNPQRGGAMVWVAVLMLAIPPMLLALANSVRLVRTVYDVRAATYTACQAAAEAAADVAHYRETGEMIVRPQTAQVVADAWYWAALKRPFNQGTVASLHVQVAVQGLEVTCQGTAVYPVWGVNRTVSLHYTATTWARFGRH